MGADRRTFAPGLWAPEGPRRRDDSGGRGEEANRLPSERLGGKPLDRRRPPLLLAIPHYVALAFVGIAAIVCVVAAWFAILFTGRYPRAVRVRRRPDRA